MFSTASAFASSARPPTRFSCFHFFNLFFSSPSHSLYPPPYSVFFSSRHLHYRKGKRLVPQLKLSRMPRRERYLRKGPAVRQRCTSRHLIGLTTRYDNEELVYILFCQKYIHVYRRQRFFLSRHVQQTEPHRRLVFFLSLSPPQDGHLQYELGESITPVCKFVESNSTSSPSPII